MSNEEQRRNIRRARQRDPILDVFMYDMPSRIYSLSVPNSKSWTEFMAKIRSKFELPSSCTICLYRATNGQFDLDNLQELDVENTNMAAMKHKFVLCVKQIENKNDDDNDSDTRSESETESDEAKKQQSNDSVSGLDLDIFGRFQISKKRQPSKSKKRAYHFHHIESLSFNVKDAWLKLQTDALIVNHIDDKHSIMYDKQHQFKLTLHRMIWPINFEHRTDEFEYKLNDICQRWKWCLLLVHGGKFAGAVYHGKEMKVHKTLRRYVTRSKQGRRQVNYQSVTGAKANSAGGFKRDLNEKKLLNEIRDVLFSWMDDIAECDKIFIHCPGVYNQMTVFGNKEQQNQLYPQNGNGEINEALSKQRLLEIKHKKNRAYHLYRKDQRIVQIPISSSKVTLQEIERVHHWLSTCWLTTY